MQLKLFVDTHKPSDTYVKIGHCAHIVLLAHDLSHTIIVSKDNFKNNFAIVSHIDSIAFVEYVMSNFRPCNFKCDVAAVANFVDTHLAVQFMDMRPFVVAQVLVRACQVFGGVLMFPQLQMVRDQYKPIFYDGFEMSRKKQRVY